MFLFWNAFKFKGKLQRWCREIPYTLLNFFHFNILLGYVVKSPKLMLVYYIS